MKSNLFLIIIIFLVSCKSNSAPGTKNTPAAQDPDLGKNEQAVHKKYFLQRPAYFMEYPYKWTIDSSDTDFDIDSYFTLDSPNNTFVSFFIFNTSIVEQDHIASQVKEILSKLIKNGKVTYFTNWKNYSGSGANVKGKILGIFNGEINVFAHTGDTLSFLKISQIYDSDREKDEEDLNIVETSFKIK